MTFLCGLRPICAHWRRRMCRARWTKERTCSQGTTSPQGNRRSTRSRFRRFGRARVDLFASKDNSHCPIFFTKSMDALAHEWPSLPLYAFPAIALLPQVLRRIKEQQHKLILIASLWRNQPRVSELFQLLEAAPWPIPLRRALLSQANGTLWHPRPELWALHVWPLNGGLLCLPESVLNMMAEARAPSTRHSEMICFLDLVSRPWLRSGHLRCVSGSLISAGDAG